MKKALLFYGFLPPNVNKYGAKYDVYLSYVYWKKHVLDCNTDLDIFIHTWDATQAQIDEVIDVFHPKSICNEKLVHADAPASSCLSMKRVNELAKGEYDMLMICRMDVIWSAPLFLENTFDPSKCTVSFWGKTDIDKNYTWDRPYHNGWYGTHDIFFVCNKNNMDILCTIYDKLEEYSARGVYYHRHTLFRHHLSETGLLSIIDHKIIIGIDMEIESRCYMADVGRNMLHKLLNKA